MNWPAWDTSYLCTSVPAWLPPIVSSRTPRLSGLACTRYSRRSSARNASSSPSPLCSRSLLKTTLPARSARFSPPPLPPNEQGRHDVQTHAVNKAKATLRSPGCLRRVLIRNHRPSPDIFFLSLSFLSISSILPVIIRNILPSAVLPCWRPVIFDALFFGIGIRKLD